jgi:hypothetical protein
MVISFQVDGEPCMLVLIDLLPQPFAMGWTNYSAPVL